MIHSHIGLLTESSHVYETEAWGNRDQGAFFNKAVVCNTPLEPEKVLEQIHIIEQKMGRERKEKWGPRIIDIDILFYGEKIIKKHNLKIPHPQLTNRSFVLTPLMDICANYVHPELHKSIRTIYKECTDTLSVRRIN